MVDYSRIITIDKQLSFLCCQDSIFMIPAVEKITVIAMALPLYLMSKKLLL